MELTLVVFGVIGFLWYKSNRLKTYIDLCYPDLENFEIDNSYSDVSNISRFYVDLSSLQLVEVSKFSTPLISSHTFKTIQLVVAQNKLVAQLKEEIVYKSEYPNRGWEKIVLVENGRVIMDENDHNKVYGSFVKYSDHLERVQNNVKDYPISGSLEAFLFIRWKQFSSNFSKFNYSIKMKGFEVHNRVLSSNYYFLKY